MDFLRGKKTYIVAAIVVVIGLAEGYLGADVPGVTVGSDPVGYILAGLGLGALRAGVSK